MASTVLEHLIRTRIEQNGPLPFADYMRMALYEPGLGYYMTMPAKMGWQGDYFTSTDVSQLFAHCMGRQLYAMWEKLKKPAPFVVVEQGAGRGDLAQEVKDWAEHEAPDLLAALDYQATDIRAGQDSKEWITTTPGASPSVILSNELVDAFPVHVIQVHNQQLYEVYVQIENGRPREMLAEPSSPAIASYLDEYKIPWRSFDEGWRAEINLDALHWMQHSARTLAKHGFILTIDYGDKATRLYTRYRSGGTLLCYYQHTLSERPLARPGEQDITTHVNFSALIDVGRRQGLRLRTFTTQRQWLEDHGLYEEMEHLRAHNFAEADTRRATDRGQIALLKWYDVRQRVATLTDPAGMGNFKVLIMHR